MSSDRQGTVCFLRNGDKILLALIHYNNGEEKWNGLGGFAEAGETLEEAVVREVQEETYLEFDKTRLTKVAELNGSFKLNVFLTDTWSGEMKIREDTIKELRWFSINEIPYSQMHKGNDEWLPLVLAGKVLKIDGGKIEEMVNL